ncbi:putative 2-oxoglutarate-Fe(II) oxygenase superfamily [Nitrospira moscoviensis]|uniref:Putative 2-oxoglutarate-Fe(II) oxygenase superfamily n=2 Tax=Nitrospira moscoviensis TaxID=42253 RepID=A0A0K2G7K3_NITMO|nr:putative 2-oxoglutarate-Fe(II) oxygenase superfamily [Nitrospira moscoviensis]
MVSNMAMGITEAVDRAVAALDVDRLHREYWEQNEFLVIRQFLPRAFVEEVLVPQAQGVKTELNRNYIPGHKKGGSVSYYTVRRRAPLFLDLYRSDSFRAFLDRLVDAKLLLCPENDPHSCALYYYTEPGDHIGFHYDTSYYKGARYTILMGLVDRSTQCKLVCELFKDHPTKAPQRLELITEPGDMVIFNGDKLWHAVTPLGEGEERIALTMEYVTNPEMGAFKRLYSNLKDSFAYFGLKTVFKQALAKKSS